MRDNGLNDMWFFRTKIEPWRLDYNRVRPRSALGNLSPEEFVETIT